MKIKLQKVMVKQHIVLQEGGRKKLENLLVDRTKILYA